MYKLPMFGCNDASQVLQEIQNATTTFPTAYIRSAAMPCHPSCRIDKMPCCTSYSCIHSIASVSNQWLLLLA